MSITAYKNSFLPYNTFLTYEEKLKNELENIPKYHKKFFMNSLAKHKFDSDIYIPMGNERNRKVYPKKDYLINKIISIDNIAKNNRKKIDTMSKNFSKFYKFYDYLKSTNTKQRDYMEDLMTIYKEKNKNNNEEDIEFKNDENIFSNSILLDCNEIHDFKKYENSDGKKILLNDKKILLNIDGAIQKTRSPNSMKNKPLNYVENFITSINQSYYINKNKKGKENDQEKKEMKSIKTEINLEKDEIKENKEDKKDKNNIKISPDKKTISKNSSKKSIKSPKNKNQIKNNTLDKYAINSRLLKINKISRNNISKELKSNKENNNTINAINTTNDSIIKEPFEKQKTQNLSKLRNFFLNKYNKDETDTKYNNNIKTYKTINNIKTNLIKDKEKKEHKEKRAKFNISEDKTKPSKYLLTTLNKINIKNKIEDISEINDNKEKTVNISRNNNKKTKSIHSTMRTNINLKINLPDIIQSHKNLSKSIMYTKINENRIHSKYDIKHKHKTAIKKENLDYCNYKKAKEEEINNLYSTIASNSNFFRGYPYNKIRTYFKKYKNIIINDIEPEKGSNIFPLLDNIENIGKNKDITKLAKSLDEMKQYFYERNSKKKEENLENKNVNIFDIINDNENKFPVIKYDSAEKIIFGEKGEKDVKNKE